MSWKDELWGGGNSTWRNEQAPTCMLDGVPVLLHLRRRVLGRKFLYLWMRNVHGGVFPSVARAWYCSKLQRMAFLHWRLVCRRLRMEWKLGMRTECQYRNHLYGVAWNSWQSFMRTPSGSAEWLFMSLAHAERHQLQRAWTTWRLYIDRRKEKLAMHLRALTFRWNTCLKYDINRQPPFFLSS
uniref:Uncharacterized protein n=1 Tax=Eptatretus burgeri TaxID=7764 RepID=A0A8C4X111_EPTBU